MISIVGSTIYNGYLLFRDLQSGKKKIVSGLVSDKREEAHFKPIINDFNSYYLIVNGQDFSVEPIVYHWVKTGDRVELHAALHSQTILTFISRTKANDAQP
ncbi:MAG: hypothetical protein RMJ87_05115 [Cytophagales bacterium]|nr:hypothetical protein [Bernardetiaceae bacterium]MDW8204389.1 hypothetical protein [Cytophagales bacterium]